jgi:4-hydroxy-tetrahydrodipicolinate reductase
MGIPTSNLSGHAYHTYSLTSENCAMDISFTHNVRGRKIYAEGTLRALDWLGKYAGSKGQIFTMQDVLKS